MYVCVRVRRQQVNMLAREYCDMAKIKFKPVILSHHMLMGLKEGASRPWVNGHGCSTRTQRSLYLFLYMYMDLLLPRPTDPIK